jgi:cyclophilin family peptidyl-prolyl cis-trans isomerase
VDRRSDASHERALREPQGVVETRGAVLYSESASLPTVTIDLAGKHVVFGRVLEGEELVKLIEGKGSSSGKTSAEITIADSGELPMEEGGAAAAAEEA